MRSVLLVVLGLMMCAFMMGMESCANESTATKEARKVSAQQDQYAIGQVHGFFWPRAQGC